ncbi:alpha-1,4-N-acetylglucosaminyltransferase-like [Gastrophryne carolinensis]
MPSTGERGPGRRTQQQNKVPAMDTRMKTDMRSLACSMKIMKKNLIFTLMLVVMAMAFINRATLKQKSYDISNFFIYNRSPVDEAIPPLLPFNATTVLRKGNGILFMETTNRMEFPSLVLCAIESAARVYPDRPVVFFIKGLKDIYSVEDEKKTKEHFPTLASFQNIYLFPLRMEKLFNNTPLLPWFKKVDPYKEVYWAHVSSDGCRLASIWKYGGIYMDSDVISLRPIPHDNFLSSEDKQQATNSVFGMAPFHPLIWQFMENFVENFRGEIWAHQGPNLFKRVMNKMCGIPVFNTMDDMSCNKIPYLHHQRFYPIHYVSWRKYYEVWKKEPTFNSSYGLHLWNSMNKEGKSMMPGTNTLVEHIYQQQCPTTYDFIVRKKKTQL